MTSVDAISFPSLRWAEKRKRRIQSTIVHRPSRKHSFNHECQATLAMYSVSALEWNSNRCNTEPEALKQNSEPTNATVDREAWVINITLIKADILHLKHHPSHSQQESARKRKSPEDTAQPFYWQDMVSSDSSTSIRSLLHPRHRCSPDPAWQHPSSSSYTPQNSWCPKLTEQCSLLML